MSQTKYVVKFITQFRKDYKLAIKRGLKIELLERIIALLAAGQSLPEKNKIIDTKGRRSFESTAAL